MQVSNIVADNLISRIRASSQSTRSPDDVKLLMDLVSGVTQYDINNINKQGVIRRTFNKERSKAVRADIINIDVSIDDAISSFWEEVFSHIDKAELTGTNVNIRQVSGSGTDVKERQTSCNPINYLRNRGILGVRNLLNASYRKNLVQVCDDCGHPSSINSSEHSTIKCSCGSLNTEKYWPDGSAAYRSKKYRRCLDCNKVWQRQFTYMCINCKSINVHIEERHHSVTDNKIIKSLPSMEDNTSSSVAAREALNDIAKLSSLILDSFPANPSNIDIRSKTADIFNLIMNEPIAAEVCRLCKDTAAKTNNVNYTCEASSLEIGTCVNYSKRIAAYQSCSSSLVSRRIERMREHVVKFITDNKNLSSTCQSLYDEMLRLKIIERYLK